MSENNLKNQALEKFLITLTIITLGLFLVTNTVSKILVILSGIVFETLQDLFVTKKSKMALQFRIIIFWLVLCFAVCFIFKSDLYVFLAIPVIIFQYVFFIIFNKVLIFHNDFLEQISPIENSFLGSTLRKECENVEEINNRIKKNKIIMQTMAIGAALFLLVLEIKQRVSLYYYVVALLFYFSLIGNIIIYNSFLNETYYAFLGFKNVNVRKNKIFKSSLKIILISAFFGFALTSNSILIDINGFIINKFNERRGYVKEKIENSNVNPYYEPLRDDGLDLFKLLRLYGQTDDEEPAVNIYVKIIAIVCLIIFALYILVKYIFTTKFLSFFKNRTLKKIIRDIIKKIKYFFRCLFVYNKSNKENNSRLYKEFENQIKDFILKSKKTGKKKVELDRLTSQFVKLIEWGEKNNIEYTTNLAPLEYTNLLKKHFDLSEETKKYSQQVDNVGHLFEKALYSEVLLTVDEETEFNQNIQNIILGK